MSPKIHSKLWLYRTDEQGSNAEQQHAQCGGDAWRGKCARERAAAVSVAHAVARASRGDSQHVRLN